MQLPSRQRGLGLWGWLFVLGMLGIIGMVTLQLIPMYLNEMAIQKVVTTVANETGSASLPPAELRRALQTRWDVDDITSLETKDIKIVKMGAGRAMSYEYERRAPLFYNISIVVQFQKTVPLKGGGPLE